MKRFIKDYVLLIHRWLGLISGLVVFIVGITGCILAFEQEIKEYTQPWQYVSQLNKAQLLPSQIKQIAEKHIYGDSAGLSGKTISALQYCGNNKAAIVFYKQPKKGMSLLYVDPYSGAIQHQMLLNSDFFRIVLGIHFYLLLPPAIGQPVVAISILVFVILLITGIILWWPKKWNRRSFQQGFTIKSGMRFKRTNYDLHKVLGFYAFLFALVFAITGLVWGFEWFERSLYWTTSGGRSLVKMKKPFSDTTLTIQLLHAEDRLWQQAQQEHDLSAARFQIGFPETKADAYAVNYNPSQETYFKREIRYFDQYTLKEIAGAAVYNKPYATATAADKLYRMNYDIHVGAIAGLPGKIFAFCMSLIISSMPITGFLIWWGRRKKSKRKAVS